MTTALAVVEPQETGLAVQQSGLMALALMSDADFEFQLAAAKRGRERIQKVQRSLMTEGVDYGAIPGTDQTKKVLYKSGAEALSQMYSLRPSYELQRVLGDGITAPNLTYLVTCRLHPQTTDNPSVGAGVGSCNTWEDKYRWRAAGRTCPDCGEESIIAGKAEYGGGWLCWKKKGGCGAKFGDNEQRIVAQQAGRVENADPFSLDNTILKMAKKRAYVDAVLETCDASDLFTQDIDAETGEIFPQDPTAAGPPAPPKPTRARRKPVEAASVPEADDPHDDAPAPEEPPDGYYDPHPDRQVLYSVAFADQASRSKYFAVLSEFQKAIRGLGTLPEAASNMTLDAIVNNMGGTWPK